MLVTKMNYWVTQSLPNHLQWPAVDATKNRSEKPITHSGEIYSRKFHSTLRQFSIDSHPKATLFLCSLKNLPSSVFVQVPSGFWIFSKSWHRWIFWQIAFQAKYLFSFNVCCNFSIIGFLSLWHVVWLGYRTTQFTFTQLFLSVPSPSYCFLA